MSVAHSFRGLAARGALLSAALLGCEDPPARGEVSPAATPGGSSRPAVPADPVASRHAPSGLYRVVIEPVRDSCDPPRVTGAALPADGMPGPSSGSTWALPGGQHGAHGWMLNVPLVSVRPPPPAPPAGLARMDLLIAPGPARKSTRPVAAGCDAEIADTYEFAGYTSDGFRILHTEEWPDLSRCSARPPGAPSAACRSERLMAFQVVEACPPDCSIRPNLSSAGGTGASCQCRGGDTVAPAARSAQ